MIAETPAHAEALAQNLAKQDFVVEAQRTDEWQLRKRRRRGDITVTIVVRQPHQPRPLTGPPTAVAPSPWRPPTGPPAR